MTHSSFVAYSELTRMLPWAIRARGYAFGTADRASFLVANAASLMPEVLADISALGERPQKTPRRQWNKGIQYVEAQGVSWLEVGPALMDYCGAHAAQHDYVSCRVTGATEASLLPAVLLVGADYSLSAAALWIECGVLHWTLLGWSNDAARRSLILSGEGRSELEQRLAGAVSLDDLQEGFEGTLLLAWCHPQMTVTVQDPNAMDVEACIHAAYAQGISVAPAVLDGLYELEKETWAPTSERSRAQAGFQPKPTG